MQVVVGKCQSPSGEQMLLTMVWSQVNWTTWCEQGSVSVNDQDKSPAELLRANRVPKSHVATENVDRSW